MAKNVYVYCDVSEGGHKQLRGTCPESSTGQRLMTRVTTGRMWVQQADLILVVVDCAQIPSDQQTVPFLWSHLQDVLPSQDPSNTERCVLVLNKLDLLTEASRQRLHLELSVWEAAVCVCCVSCHTREGLPHLLTELQLRLKHLCGDPLSGGPSLTQARHRAHLQQCVSSLHQFQSYRPSDLALAAEGLRLALTSLGRITGRIGPEEILDIIFKDFCIGK